MKDLNPKPKILRYYNPDVATSSMNVNTSSGSGTNTNTINCLKLIFSETECVSCRL